MSADETQQDPADMHVLGTRVDLVTVDETVERMARWIDGPEAPCRFVVNTGFHGLWTAHKDREFQEIVASSDLFTPDGIAPLWIARLRLAAERGYSNYFLGGAPETLEALEVKLQEDYPGLKVAGTYSPPFRPLSAEEERAMIEGINAARPDVLWVGLGLPKQERWIHRYQGAVNAKVSMGVGACFGFFAGTLSRSPELLGRMGLEWAWRFMHEPRKLWRRVMIDGPQFLFHVGLEELGLRKYGEEA